MSSLSLLMIDAEGLDIDITMAFMAAGVYPNIVHIEILGQPLKNRSSFPRAD